ELKITPSAYLELFSDFLADTLPVGFEERDGSFIVRSEDELETISWGVEQFKEALEQALQQPIDVEIELTKEKNSDWVKSYQESITPIEIGPFYIHPTWNEAKEGMLNIELDPALAFGTGHHPTTAACLEAIASEVKAGMEVADIGCGSGILGIAAAKMGAIVDACDTDPVSVGNSLQNAEVNGVEFREIWEGSAPATQKKYDVVIANIVADVLVFIASDLKRLLKDEGTLVLSGILDKYEDKVLKAYVDCKIEKRIQREEWVTLVVTKKGK
ncbi:MAG: 50S ribosomal protein L11 methyltransferase, partial [Sulfurimonadaceae bacterium]